MAVVAVVALGAHAGGRSRGELPRLAFEEGHGSNVVNVMLVDIRAWDTMGEISVLVVVATGVASLIFLTGRAGDAPAAAAGPSSSDRGQQPARACSPTRSRPAPRPVRAG